MAFEEIEGQDISAEQQVPQQTTDNMPILSDNLQEQDPPTHAQSLYRYLINDKKQDGTPKYTTDDLGKEDDFVNAIKDSANASNIYKTLLKDGYTDVDLGGSESDFLNTFVDKKKSGGNGLQETKETEFAPSANYAGTQDNQLTQEPNPNDIIGMARLAGQKRIKTKTLQSPSVGGATMGATSTTEVPDEQSVAEADKIDADITAQGYNPKKLRKDFQSIPNNVLQSPGYTPTELLNDYKNNPPLYERKLNSAQWQTELKKQTVDKGNSQAFNDAMADYKNTKTIPLDIYDPTTLSFIRTLKANIDVNVEDKDAKQNISDHLFNDLSYVYGKQKVDPNDEFLPKLGGDSYATLGYRIIQDLKPEVLNKYKLAFLTDADIAEDHEADITRQSLRSELNQIGQNSKYVYATEELNKTNKDFLPLAKKVENKEELTQEEADKYNQLIDQRQPYVDIVNGIVEEQETIASKYPLPIVYDASMAARDVLQIDQNPFARLGNVTARGISDAFEGLKSMILNPTLSDKDEQIRQAHLLGAETVENARDYRTEETKTSKESNVVVEPALQTQIDAIKNDKNLSDSEKLEKTQILLASNPMDWHRQAIEGGDTSLNVVSTLYGIGDLAASLVPFIAAEFMTGGMAAPSALGKFASTFTAAAITSFNQQYNVSSARGDANPYREAMISTAINSAAMAGAGTPQAIRNILGNKTAIGQMVSKLDDETILKALRNDKSAFSFLTKMKNVGLNIKEAAVTGAKEAAKITSFIKGGEIVNDARRGELKSGSEYAKESFLSFYDMSMMNLGLGIIGKTAKEGGITDYDTDVVKSAIYESAKNPLPYLNILNEKLRKGEYTPEQASQIRKNMMNANNILTTNLMLDRNGNPLNDKSKRELLFLNMQEIDLTQTLDSKKIPNELKDKINERIDKIQEKADKIYSGSFNLKGKPLEEKVPLTQPTDIRGEMKLTRTGNAAIQDAVESGAITEEEASQLTDRKSKVDFLSSIAIQARGEKLKTEEDRTESVTKLRNKYGNYLVDEALKLFPETPTETKELLDSEIKSALGQASTYISSEDMQNVTTTFGKVNNAENINENELNDTEDKLYNALDKHPNAAHLIEPLILKLQDYDFRTTTKTVQTAEEVPVEDTRKTPTRPKRVSKNIEQWEGSRATVTDENGNQVEGVIRMEDGKYHLFNDKGEKVAVLGEKQITDRDISLPSKEDVPSPIEVDKDGNVRSITLQLNRVDKETGGLVKDKTIKINFRDPEAALDYAISLRAEEVGEVPDAAFESATETIIRENNIEVPVERPVKEEKQKERQQKREEKKQEEKGEETEPTKKEEKKGEKKEGEETEETPKKKKKMTTKEKWKNWAESHKKENKKEREQQDTPAQTITKDNIDKVDTTNYDNEQKKALKDAKKILNAVSNFVKAATGQEVKLVLHSNDESFIDAAESYDEGADYEGLKAKGFYMDTDGSIHLNMPRITPDTITHEFFHPILDFIEKNNPKKIDEFFAALEKVPGAEDIVANAKEMYAVDGDVTVKKEAITDFVAQVASGKIEINNSNFAKIRNYVVGLLNKLGLSLTPKQIADLDNAEGLRDLANLVTGKFTKGEELTTEEVKKFAEPSTSISKEIKEPTDEQIEKDIKEKNFVSFTYKSEADVPQQYKDRISSRGEINGEKFVRVTLPKSVADYELAKVESKATSPKDNTPSEFVDSDGNPIPKGKAQYSIINNFSNVKTRTTFTYIENEKEFEELKKKGIITNDLKLEDFEDGYMVLHSPDAAFTGNISIDDKNVIEGKGGIYYPIKFNKEGYFWASTKGGASGIVNLLNKASKLNKDGKVYMALVSAPSDKLLSSTTAANGVIDFFHNLSQFKELGLSENIVKNALRQAAKQTINKVKKNSKGEAKTIKVGLNLSIPSTESMDNIISIVREKLAADKSIFEDRKQFVINFLNNIADKVAGTKVEQKIGKFLHLGIENVEYKQQGKLGDKGEYNKYKLSAANLKQSISHMLQEPLLRGEQSGNVYAVLEVDPGEGHVEGEDVVKAVNSDKHESYPVAVKPIKEGVKIKLHILQDREKWNENFIDPQTNEIVTTERELQLFPTSGITTTPLQVATKKSTKQKPQFAKEENGIAKVINAVNVELKKNQYDGKLLNEKQSEELQKEIESKYSKDSSDIFNKDVDDIRMKLFNYDNPAAEKTINGVDVRIVSGLLRENKKTGRTQATFLLYGDGKIVGEFYSVKEAEAAVKYIEDNLVKSLPTKAELPQPKIVEKGNFVKDKNGNYYPTKADLPKGFIISRTVDNDPGWGILFDNYGYRIMEAPIDDIAKKLRDSYPTGTPEIKGGTNLDLYGNINNFTLKQFETILQNLDPNGEWNDMVRQVDRQPNEYEAVKLETELLAESRTTLKEFVTDMLTSDKADSYIGFDIPKDGLGKTELPKQKPQFAKEGAIPTSNKDVSDAVEKMRKENEDVFDEAVFNWAEAEVVVDYDGKISFKAYPGRDRMYSRGKEGGSFKPSKKEFINWLTSDEPFDSKKYTQDESWVNNINKLRESLGIKAELPQQKSVEQLRAEEKAEYEAMPNPNDKAKRQEIYDRYDKLITPLLKGEGETKKPQFSKEEGTPKQTIEKAGLKEEDIEKWREQNKVRQKNLRVPEVQKAAEDLKAGKINQGDYIETVRKEQPIKPFKEVPPVPSVKEVIGSLDKNKVAKGIVGVNVDIPNGTRVGLRLDIPAYENYNTYVVSIHDAAGDSSKGNAIGYGQTGVIKDVKFSTQPSAALAIAMGKAKSSIARMYGDWQNEDPKAVHDRAAQLMKDPEWTQVGLNLFRHSWFYDKSDGMPIKSAKEVIQVGALVLAKGIEKISPEDPTFKAGEVGGKPIQFAKSKLTKEEQKVSDMKDIVRDYVEEGYTLDEIKELARGEFKDMGLKYEPSDDEVINQAYENYTTTSIKNRVTTRERVERDKKELAAMGKRTYGKVFDNAKEMIANREIDPRRLAIEMAQKGRALSAEEGAALMIDRMEISNDYNKTLLALDEAVDKGDENLINALESKLSVLEEDMDINDQASRNTGYENGLGLGIRRLLINRDYSMATQMQRLRSITKGKDVPKQFRDKLIKLTNELDEANKKLKEFEDKLKEQGVKEEVKKTKKTDKTEEQRKTERTSILNKIKDAWNSLTQKEEPKEGDKNVQFAKAPTFAPISPAKQAQLEAITPEVSKLVKSYAEGGVTDLNDIIDQIHTSLTPLISGISKEDVRDVVMGRYKTDVPKAKLTAAQIQAQSNVKRVQAQIDLLKDQLKLQERGKGEKFWDYLHGWHRFALLSGVPSVGKIGMAALIHRGVSSLAEGVIGKALSYVPGIRAIAKGAPVEGTMSASAEAKAFTTWFDKMTRQDLRQVMKTGVSELDYMYGDKREFASKVPEWMEFFGKFHSAIKLLPKRAAFFRSLEMRSKRALQEGRDLTDVEVQQELGMAAYQDGLRAVFMQDNPITDFYKAGVQKMDKSGSPMSKPLAGFLQFAFPIVKVPTNYVIEESSYAVGILKAGLMLKKGFSKLTADDKDYIMRALKKQSIGAAFMYMGYCNPDMFGGYYSGKRKDEDLEAGDVVAFGVHLPHWMMHSPLIEMLQLGATIRRSSDTEVQKGKEPSVTKGIPTAFKGVIKQVPFFGGGERISQALENEKSLAGYTAELLSSVAVPQAVQNISDWTDLNGEGEVTKRLPSTQGFTPSTFTETIMEKTPFRKGLESKKELFEKDDLETPNFKLLQDKGVEIPFIRERLKIKVVQDDAHPNGVMTKEEYDTYAEELKKGIEKGIKDILSATYEIKEGNKYTYKTGKNLEGEDLEDKIKKLEGEVSREIMDNMKLTPKELKKSVTKKS
jgi:hypothetical protein